MTAEGFTLDPAFEAVTCPLRAAYDLCDVRLMQDARFPWLVLIPRRAGAVEIEDLQAADRALLMAEILRAGTYVRAIGDVLGRPVEKLNVAALGNVTPQLHVHVIGRRRDDEAWPRPVWGVGESVAYDTAQMARIMDIGAVLG
jgi:diadenosine tetraphosphate (Ap4A) HIT family hydrolase